MACESVSIPGGLTALVCSSRRHQRCACGRRATLLCDWKVPLKRGTCDVSLCARCTTTPAPDKDLCPEHARAFDAWRTDRAVSITTSSGGEPEAAPLPVPDAPTVPAADVSAPESRSSRRDARRRRGARGQQPEAHHA